MDSMSASGSGSERSPPTPETLYNLLREEDEDSARPPRYMSRFRPMVLQETKETKRPMKTMGPARVDFPDPDKFLKRRPREPALQQDANNQAVCRECTGRRPPVPTRADAPPMGRGQRGFIPPDALVTRKPDHICVDTRRGHKQRLENSGLVPKYIKKKGYGEVPEYLLKCKEIVQRSQREYENFVKEQQEHEAMTTLSVDERKAVLEGLKNNWNELHHEYQGLSLVTDTLSKKSRKERLETSLKQLEDDIDLFERFKVIYVSNH